MGRADPRYLVVGHINRAHGIKGELFVWPLTDHPEGVYAPGVVFYLGDGTSGEPDPDLPPLRLEKVRPFRRGYLMSFGGVDDRNGAELVRGHYLLQVVDDLPPLEGGELFYHQLLGLEVVTARGRVLGTVREVYEVRPADLLDIRGEEGSFLVPFLEDIVVEIDAEEGRLVIDPPEGMLDL